MTRENMDNKMYVLPYGASYSRAAGGQGCQDKRSCKMLRKQHVADYNLYQPAIRRKDRQLEFDLTRACMAPE